MKISVCVCVCVCVLGGGGSRSARTRHCPAHARAVPTANVLYVLITLFFLPRRRCKGTSKLYRGFNPSSSCAHILTVVVEEVEVDVDELVAVVVVVVVMVVVVVVVLYNTRHAEYAWKKE